MREKEIARQTDGHQYSHFLSVQSCGHRAPGSAGLYLHGDLLHQVPHIRVVEGDAVHRGPINNQLPQHGALLPDLLGQAASVDACRPSAPPSQVSLEQQSASEVQSIPPGLVWFGGHLAACTQTIS